MKIYNYDMVIGDREYDIKKCCVHKTHGVKIELNASFISSKALNSVRYLSFFSLRKLSEKEITKIKHKMIL